MAEVCNRLGLHISTDNTPLSFSNSVETRFPRCVLLCILPDLEPVGSSYRLLASYASQEIITAETRLPTSVANCSPLLACGARKVCLRQLFKQDASRLFPSLAAQACLPLFLQDLRASRARLSFSLLTIQR